MATQRRNLEGLHVAISGGARGIGETTARLLATRGAKVSLGDINVAGVEATAASIAADARRFGEKRAIGLSLDVSDEESFGRFFDEAIRAHGPVDVMINNAGIMNVEALAEAPTSVSRAQIDINVLGVVIGTQLALSGFGTRAGHVINISSIAGQNPFAHLAVYSGTKYFVHGFTESLRAEYAATDVEFTTVFPNIAHTELGKGVSGIKLVPKSTPEQIAEAIVGAIERPRPYVHIPRGTAILNAASLAAPPRIRDAAFALLGADHAMTDIDENERKDYEATLEELEDD